MTFKLVISDPKTRKALQKEVEESGLIGRKVGDKISGDIFGLQGYELEITGGSDKQGFPIRPGVEGPGRKKILLAFPPGFHPQRKGQRKRKSVRGNTISSEISQVNTKIVKYGTKSIEELLGIKEKPKEVKKEEKPVEKVKEKKEPEKVEKKLVPERGKEMKEPVEKEVKKPKPEVKEEVKPIEKKTKEEVKK